MATRSNSGHDLHCNAEKYIQYQEFITREGERVSNSVLYILYNKSAESNVTSGLTHVTKPRSQPLYFSPEYESRGVFRDFATRTLGLYRIRLVFSLGDMALSLTC